VSPAELTSAVHDNLRNLKRDDARVVNFRQHAWRPMGAAEGSIEAAR